MFSLIIPTFNEEASVTETVRTAHETLTGAGEEFEILLINDGSTDGTAARLSEMQLPNLTVITHPRNTGYSASIKTGIRRAKGEVLGITDADGTYPIGQFPHLLHVMREGNLDMVIGARVKKGVKIPLIRRPAKFIVNKLANMLTGMRIPDLNSGMRIFTKEFALRFMHIYPQRFSFTITTTLAALTNDYLVEFVRLGAMFVSRRLKAHGEGLSVDERWRALVRVQREFAVVLRQPERLESSGLVPDKCADVLEAPGR